MATDEPIEFPEKKFEIKFFNKLLDTSLMSMKERFKQLLFRNMVFFVQYKKDT